MDAPYLLATATISSTGSLQWLRLYEGLYGGLGVVIPEGGAIVTGQTAPSNYGTGLHRVAKVDANGNVVWDRTYGQDVQEPRAMAATADGGCLIACHRTVSTATGSGNTYSYINQVVLRKLNSVGDEIWVRYLESPSGEMGISRMTPVNGGGYVLVGGPSQILRVDAEGNALWWNQYVDYITTNTVDLVDDGGFVLVGTTSETFPAPAVLKTDAGGNLLWKAEDIIPNQGKSQYTVRDAVVDSAGRIVVVGQVERVAYIGNFFPVISDNGFIMQLDSSAHLNWIKTLDNYTLNAIAPTSTGDYIATGIDSQTNLQVFRVSQSGAVM